MKKLSVLLSLILGALCGFVVGIGMVSFAGENFSFWTLLYELFCLVIAFTGQLMIHELGHLVYGLRHGYRFLSFRIFSYVLQKEEGRWVVRRFSLPETGGQCLMAPPAWNGGVFDTTWYNAGGFLFNLYACILSGILAFLFRGNPWLYFFFFLFSAAGFFCALTNAIPLRTSSGIDNDGYNILHLKEDREARRAFWVSLEANARQNQGVRLKELPAEWFHVEEINSPLSASLAVMEENRYMDLLDFEKARACIERLKKEKNLPAIYQNLLLVDEMTLDLYENQGYKARLLYEEKKMQSFLKSFRGLPGVQRFQYLYARYGRKDPALAEKLWNVYTNTQKTYPNAGEFLTESAIIEKFEQFV